MNGTVSDRHSGSSEPGRCKPAPHRSEKRTRETAIRTNVRGLQPPAFRVEWPGHGTVTAAQEVQARLCAKRCLGYKSGTAGAKALVSSIETRAFLRAFSEDDLDHNNLQEAKR